MYTDNELLKVLLFFEEDRERSCLKGKRAIRKLVKGQWIMEVLKGPEILILMWGWGGSEDSL